MTVKVSIILEKSNYPWWKVVKVKVSTNLERSKGPRCHVVRARVCAHVEKWMLWRDHYSSVAKCWKQKKVKYEDKDKNSKTKIKGEKKWKQSSCARVEKWGEVSRSLLLGTNLVNSISQISFLIDKLLIQVKYT